MYDDGIEDIEFPTPVCPDTAPHAKHRIVGTWREECPGVKATASAKGLPADEGPAHLDGCMSEGGIGTCADGCPRFAAIAATRGESQAAVEQWIADQIAQLSENELVLVKTVLDEIRAGRPVEHFMPGTKVYADSWGTAEFIVQGTAPWYDENGVAHRKVEIKSAGGGLSGHVHPSELRRVPSYSPASACTCPLGPEHAHFPDCPWYMREGDYKPVVDRRTPSEREIDRMTAEQLRAGR